MRRRTLLPLLGLLPFTSAQAQRFPDRPITLVVGFPPGTASDTTSRFLADKLSASLGVPVTVENRPGVDGSLAATAVARSRPDGHTLIYSTNSAHAANLSLYRSIVYDPVADFTPVAGILRQPTVLLVRPDTPVDSVAALVALSRSRDGGLTYGYGNSSTRIVGAMLEQRGGVRATGVAFRGNPQSLTELLAGRLDFVVTDAFTGAGQVRAGALRPLAVSSDAETAGFPGVPSLVALGVLDSGIVAWTGIFGPAGMPEPVVTQLAAALLAAMQTQEAEALRARLVSDPFPLDSAALRRHVQAEVGRWVAFVRIAGIEPQ